MFSNTSTKRSRDFQVLGHPIIRIGRLKFLTNNVMKAGSLLASWPPALGRARLTLNGCVLSILYNSAVSL